MANFESLDEVPLGFILNKLDRKSAQNCRLVNRSLNQATNSLYENWSVSIRDNTPKAISTSLFKLKAAKVNVDLPIPSEETDLEFFKYPALIQSLQCVEDEDSLGTNAEHLLTILKPATNLRKLELHLTPITMNGSANPQAFAEVFFNFSELRALSLHLVETKDCFPLMEFNLFTRLLRYSEMPEIKSVSLSNPKVDGPSTEMLIADFFLFVERYGPKLKRLGYSANRPFLIQPATGFGFLDTCTTLEELKIESDSPVFTFPASYDTWVKLIQRQTTLTSLSINCGLDYMTFRNNMLPSLCSTIRDISFKNVRIEPMRMVRGHRMPDFDLSIFAECPNLQRLTLSLWGGGQTVINAASLPPGILELEIDSFAIGSDELLQICSNVNRVGLAKLKFLSTEFLSPEGLTGRGLRDLMISPNLREITFSYGSVRKEERDVEYLLEICRSIGQEDAGVFDNGEGINLYRENVESRWKFRSTD